MKQSSTPKPASRRASKPASAPRKARAARSVASPIPREEIERLAHSYWEARGCSGGSPEEDWHRAEQELMARRSAAAQE